jgi:hypothetical protein
MTIVEKDKIIPVEPEDRRDQKDQKIKCKKDSGHLRRGAYSGGVPKSQGKGALSKNFLRRLAKKDTEGNDEF